MLVFCSVIVFGIISLLVTVMSSIWMSIIVGVREVTVTVTINVRCEC